MRDGRRRHLSRTLELQSIFQSSIAEPDNISQASSSPTMTRLPPLSSPLQPPSAPPPSLPWPAKAIHTLLPSFVSDLVWPDHRPVHRLRPTSYLDGLRGLASLVVFLCHYTEELHPRLVPSHGFNPDTDGGSSFLQLPILRVVYSGRPMVHVFFVVSGFVLSHKPLRALVQGRSMDRCAAALASSAFRRPVRLFGPCLVSTLLVAIVIQSGRLYEPAPSLAAQLRLWVAAVFHSVTWPWDWDRDLRPGYDVHLWTIPIEFAHSMLLFLVVLALSAVRSAVRRSAVACLCLYSLLCGKWAAFEFLVGALLAETRILAAAASISSSPANRPPPRPPHCPRILATVYNLVVAAFLFVAGWPNLAAERTPGIAALHRATPAPFAPEVDLLHPQKFWFALSAAALVWVVADLPWARRCLESSPSQYAGRVSYAVYIVHGPVLALFQEQHRPNKTAPGAGEQPPPPPSPEELARQAVVLPWLLGLATLAPAVIWAADLFWRLVDVPMVEGARWLESLVLDGEVVDGGKRAERIPLGEF